MNEVLKLINDLKEVPYDESDILSITWNNALDEVVKIIQADQKAKFEKAEEIYKVEWDKIGEPLKTNFNIITESADSLIDEIMDVQLATVCGIARTREEYLNYLNQKVDV